MAAVKSCHRKAAVRLVGIHPLALRFIKQVLSHDHQFEVAVTERLCRPDSVQAGEAVTILDVLGLPLPIEHYVRILSSASQTAPILLICNSNSTSEDDMCQLMLHGVCGFVDYTDVEEQLCFAMEALLKGHLWTSPKVLERCVQISSKLAKRRLGNHAKLSSRESLIVSLLRRRRSNKEIAHALGISERTVRFHLQNIFDKFGIHDRYRVADMALAEMSGREKSGAAPPTAPLG